MNQQPATAFLRERGYEALFYLAGFLALSLRPTMAHAMELEQQIGEILLRRKELEVFKKKGLVEGGGKGAEGILRLTELGQRAFAGGRRPEEAWNRPWDGQWRLVLFDLPRDARATRAKFWRWLRANHFGHFQGSVWIGPDPVPDLREAARNAGLESSMLVLFTGQVDDKNHPREIAAEAWDFEAINRGFQLYMDTANQVLQQTRKQIPSPAGLKALLREDRKQWWSAVRSDPLLPMDLNPKGYLGPAAWKVRQKLHATLLRTIEFDKIP